MGSRRGRLLILLGLTGSLVVSCTNSPPPPLVTTPPARTTPSRPVDYTQVVVGVDSVAGGYNPHLLANQTLVARTLGELVLPSVFHAGPDGTPQLDQGLMVSAEVTKAEPYTVTYTIRKEAAWSDGPPIAAEDFAYLWQNMRSQPGVADPAGYRLITSVSGRADGRIVDVTFSRPYPGWRSLFNDLLPSHVFKDAPGGWARALTEAFPVAGGPFSIRSVDPERREIVLERNDRYWGTSTKLQQVILRGSAQADMVSAMRTGDDQLAVLGPTKATYDGLVGLGKAIELSVAPTPVVVDLLLRQNSPRLSDPRLRAAVAAAIDRDALITIGSAGGPDSQLRADSPVLAPSRPGFTPSIPAQGSPAKPEPDAVKRLLTAAGYAEVNGAWLRDDRPLSLVIGAPGDRTPYAAVAKAVQQQLTAVGIGSRIIDTGGDQLFDQVLTTTTTPTSTDATRPAESDSTVDVAVVPQSVGGDPATVLASTFGCPVALADGTVPAANPAGFCDRDLQPVIDAALTGAMPLSEALATVEPALWRQQVVIPLFQLADVLATRPEIVGVTVGPPLVGPFAGAAGWTRIARR